MSAEPIAPVIEEPAQQAAEQAPPVEAPVVLPPEGWRLPFSRNTLVSLGGLCLLALVPLPWGDYGFYIGAYAVIYAMIGLSVTVVTGYAGLISLMPYSFAGIGAVVTGLAMESWGWPFWLAVALAAAATVPIALIAGAV